MVDLEQYEVFYSTTHLIYNLRPSCLCTTQFNVIIFWNLVIVTHFPVFCSFIHPSQFMTMATKVGDRQRCSLQEIQTMLQAIPSTLRCQTPTPSIQPTKVYHVHIRTKKRIYLVWLVDSLSRLCHHYLSQKVIARWKRVVNGITSNKKM